MDEIDWKHAKEFLIEVARVYNDMQKNESVDREVLAEEFERKGKGRAYERMQIRQVGLRVYERPTIEDVLNKIHYLRAEGFSVMDHGHVPCSEHLYFVLTEESGIKMPTETAFEPRYAEWMEDDEAD